MSTRTPTPTSASKVDPIRSWFCGKWSSGKLTLCPFRRHARSRNKSTRRVASSSSPARRIARLIMDACACSTPWRRGLCKAGIRCASQEMTQRRWYPRKEFLWYQYMGQLLPCWWWWWFTLPSKEPRNSGRVLRYLVHEHAHWRSVVLLADSKAPLVEELEGITGEIVIGSAKPG